MLQKPSNISNDELPKKELRKVHRYLLDKELREINQKWHLLSEEQKTVVFCRMCYGLWLLGKDTPASWSDILFGAWICYTRPIHDAWFELLDQLADEDLRISICGVLTVIFYVLIMARSLGAP